MPDAAQDILAPLNVSDSVKADAWDAYHNAQDHMALTPALMGIKIPQEAKAELWDAKVADMKSKSAQPTQFEQQRQQRPSILSSIGQAAQTSLSSPESVGSTFRSMMLPLPIPSAADAGKYTESQIAAGNPIRAGIGSFYQGAATDLAKFGSAMTSPLNLGLMAASGGTSLPARAVAGAAALGYGASGAAQAIKGQQPGESFSDSLQRRLLGASQAVGSIAFTGAKIQNALGNFLTKHFGLSSDYANKVAGQVAEVQKARTSATASQQAISDRVAQGLRTADAARVQSVEAITSQLDADMKALESETGVRISNIQNEAAQTGAQLQGRMSDLQAQHTQTGKQVLADTAQAVYQEHAAVTKPFDEIGAAITEPVTTADQVRKIISAAGREAGIQPGEIPGRATAALAKSERTNSAAGLTGKQSTAAINAAQLLKSGMSVADVRGAMGNLGFLPREIDSIMLANNVTSGSTAPVSFNDLNRVGQDLVQAAQASKDGAVRGALMSAYDKISDMRETVADNAGLGDKYRAAKAGYKSFIRGAGSGLMNDLLSAKDVEDQAIAPKLAQLTNPSTAEALRTVLKTLGVDVSPLDKITAEMAGTKGQIKALPKQTASQIGQAQEASGSVAKNIKTQAGIGLRSAAAEAGAAKGSVRYAGSADMGEARATGNAAINEAQQKGSIVPGKGAEELQGLSSEQINAERLQGLLKGARATGVGNPGGLVMMAYGLARMASGSPFGAMPFMYGASRTALPDLIKTPEFQAHVLEMTGMTPTGANKIAVRRAMTALAPILAVAASGAKNRPNIPGNPNGNQ